MTALGTAPIVPASERTLKNHTSLRQTLANTFTMAYYLYPKTQQLCRGDTVMKNLFNETK